MILEERAYFVQLEASLQEHFGYSSFRPGQKEIINTILSGQDTLGILPTGEVSQSVTSSRL